MGITVILLHKDRLYNGVVNPGEEMSFGSHKKDSVFVEDFTSKHISIKCKKHGVMLDAKGAYNLVDKDAPIDKVIMLDRDTNTCLFLTNKPNTYKKTFSVPYGGIYKVGRKTEDNDIAIQLPFVSGNHLKLTIENGSIRVEDNNSSNGTYINGRKISIARMKAGDVLSILSVNIKYEKDHLAFSGVDEQDVVFRIKTQSQDNYAEMSYDTMDLIYPKSPRMQESLPSEDILLAAPPTKGQKFEKSRGSGAMIASTAAMVGASVVAGAVSPALLLARGASMIAPIASVSDNSKMNRKRKKSFEAYQKERQLKYGAYIENQRAVIGAVAEEQRRILTKENPSPERNVKVVFDMTTALWERSFGDRDYLDVRVGMGYEDLCVSVKSRNNSNGFQMEDDEAEELCEQIIEETKIVDNVPLRLSFLKYNSIGFIGRRNDTINLVRNMIVSLCTSHSYDDVKLVGLFDEEEQDFWEPIKWLPHVWDAEKQNRFISYSDKSNDDILEYLTELLSNRKRDISGETNTKATVPSPYYVIIFGSKRALENKVIMNYLFENKPEMGLTSLFLFDEMSMLPSGCNLIVDMNNRNETCVYEPSKVNFKRYFTPDEPISNSLFNSFTRRMSAIKLVGFAKKTGLPKSCSFLEGYGVKRVEDLNIIRRWEKERPYESLAAPLGILAGNAVFSLDIHEKAHGPHGLVAGTTGSGKSEILQSWILSMACTYHPHSVSFVLIDYKGGGMANLLEPLPHVVGKITNIGSNINRSLVSLESELKRRQIIFDKYDVNHIDKYQRLYKNGMAKEPLPHLVIVADEFAELKKEEPEFMSGLIRAARVGRSLGVHLILATQKPGGVVDDQIQSNSRFRLCLKVQDAADSREMIKRPDAAKITQAGRSYIRVGEDEYFDIFQSFWSGAAYAPEGNSAVSSENLINIVDLSGLRLNPAKNNRRTKQASCEEITAVVNYVAKVAEHHKIKPVKGPWLPELPEKLELSNIMPKNIGFDGKRWNNKPSWLSVPIGMFDMPESQSQGVQYIDLAANGHHAIYGAPGTGKTTMLKTIIASLCMNYTPDDVNIYGVDFGGWGLSVFENMPHVGGIALDCDEDKIAKLDKMIREEINRRKKLFLENSVSSLAAYRESISAKLPAIVIVIDNIVPIFDAYPEFESFLVKLASEGTTYGMYLIYSSNSTSGVRYKIVQNIKGAVAFDLTDRGDFANIVGRLEGRKLPRVMGRAFAKANPPVEFQAALFANGDSDFDRTNALSELIVNMNLAWTGNRAEPIPVIPEKVSYDVLFSRYTDRFVVPIGIDRVDINPYYVDFSDAYCFTVTGTIGSGKSKFLNELARMICSKNEDAMLYVYDSADAQQSSLKDMATKYVVFDNSADVSESIGMIIDELNKRKKEQSLAKVSVGDSFDEKEFIKDYPIILIVVDDLPKFFETVTDESRDSMERICRLARNLGIIFICAGRTSEIEKYSHIEILTSTVISYQNGLCLNGTPKQHMFFKNNLNFNENDIELEPGNGYSFFNGKCMPVKYMKS